MLTVTDNNGKNTGSASVPQYVQDITALMLAVFKVTGEVQRYTTPQFTVTVDKDPVP